jgi:protease I
MTLSNQGNSITGGLLSGLRVAILATKGVEQAELTEPKKALEEAGATVEVISPEDLMESGEIRSWNGKDWGEMIAVDVKLSKADASRYDALHLPGGVMNPDYLRQNPEAVAFAKSFFQAGKPVFAICHAAWTLIEAGVVAGRRMTSWPSLHTDLRNAGANWIDQQVVIDGNLITSRNPQDIPAFNRAIIEQLGSMQKASK